MGCSVPRQTVCLGGGKQVQGLGDRGRARKIVLKSQLSGLEEALETPAEHGAVGEFGGGGCVCKGDAV